METDTETYSQALDGEREQIGALQQILPLELQEPQRRGGGTVGAKGAEDTKRRWCRKSTKQGLWGLTEPDVTNTDPITHTLLSIPNATLMNFCFYLLSHFV